LTHVARTHVASARRLLMLRRLLQQCVLAVVAARDAGGAVETGPMSGTQFHILPHLVFGASGIKNHYLPAATYGSFNVSGPLNLAGLAPFPAPGTPAFETTPAFVKSMCNISTWGPPAEAHKGTVFVTFFLFLYYGCDVSQFNALDVTAVIIIAPEQSTVWPGAYRTDKTNTIPNIPVVMATLEVTMPTLGPAFGATMAALGQPPVVRLTSRDDSADSLKSIASTGMMVFYYLCGCNNILIVFVSFYALWLTRHKVLTWDSVVVVLQGIACSVVLAYRELYIFPGPQGRPTDQETWMIWLYVPEPFANVTTIIAAWSYFRLLFKFNSAVRNMICEILFGLFAVGWFSFLWTAVSDVSRSATQIPFDPFKFFDFLDVANATLYHSMSAVCGLFVLIVAFCVARLLVLASSVKSHAIIKATTLVLKFAALQTVGLAFVLLAAYANMYQVVVNDVIQKPDIARNWNIIACIFLPFGNSFLTTVQVLFVVVKTRATSSSSSSSASTDSQT